MRAWLLRVAVVLSFGVLAASGANAMPIAPLAAPPADAQHLQKTFCFFGGCFGGHRRYRGYRRHPRYRGYARPRSQQDPQVDRAPGDVQAPSGPGSARGDAGPAAAPPSSAPIEAQRKPYRPDDQKLRFH